MEKIEQKKKEIECIENIIKEFNTIQEKLIWCRMETKAYIFILNLMDLVYKVFDSIIEQKYKELNKLQEQYNNWKYKQR